MAELYIYKLICNLIQQLAEEQGVLQQKMVALESEVERHDNEIKNLQKQLKEAEQLLVIYLLKYFHLQLNNF